RPDQKTVWAGLTLNKSTLGTCQRALLGRSAGVAPTVRAVEGALCYTSRVAPLRWQPLCSAPQVRRFRTGVTRDLHAPYGLTPRTISLTSPGGLRPIVRGRPPAAQECRSMRM